MPEHLCSGIMKHKIMQS